MSQGLRAASRFMHRSALRNRQENSWLNRCHESSMAKFLRQSQRHARHASKCNGCSMANELGNWNQYRVHQNSRVRLASIPADSTDFCGEKKNARKQLKAWRKEIDERLGAL